MIEQYSLAWYERELRQGYFVLGTYAMLLILFGVFYDLIPDLRVQGFIFGVILTILVHAGLRSYFLARHIRSLQKQEGEE